jgi:4'-phosphopantetheinyl transferase
MGAQRAAVASPWEAVEVPGAGAEVRVWRFPYERRASRERLREVLGAHLGMDPGEIPLREEASGRPVLDGGPAISHSHSGEWTLVAVSHGRRVGVDVERVRAGFPVDRFARRFFSSREQAALGRLSAADREDAFFALWTRKEALLKATGEGLAGGLEDCAVPVTALGAEHGARAGTVSRRGTSWDLHTLNLGDGYRATLAIEHSSPRTVLTFTG